MQTRLWVLLVLSSSKLIILVHCQGWIIFVGLLNSTYEWSNDLKNYTSDGFKNLQTPIENEGSKYIDDNNKTLAVISFEKSFKVIFNVNSTTSESDILFNMSSVYSNMPDSLTTIFWGGPARDDSNRLYQVLRFPVFNTLNTSSTSYQEAIDYLEFYMNCFYAEAYSNKVIRVTELTHENVLVNFAVSESSNLSAAIDGEVFHGQVKPKLQIEERKNTTNNASYCQEMYLFDAFSCVNPDLNSWTTESMKTTSITDKTTDLFNLAKMGLNVTTSEALNKVLDYIEYALQTKNVREESVNQISTFLLDTVEKFQSSSIKIEEVTLKNITLVIASSAEISSNTNSQNGQSIFHPFMRALEKFSSITIIPEGKSSVTIKTPKIILNIVDVIGTNNFRKSIFYNNTILADIHIPKSVFLNANQSTRVTVVVYSGLTTPTHYGELNKIISVKVGERKITGLKEKIKLSFATEQKLGQKNIPDTLLSIKTLAECIFYDDESKQWSTRGCFLESGSNPITCHVDHLTNFAIIVSSEQVTRDVTLGIVSQIGCILSITSLIFTIVLYLYSKKWKKNRPSLELLHICMNLIIAYIIFLTGVTPTGNRATCITVTALLQYFYLTAWGWIGIYTRDMYLSLVQVYSSQSRKYMAKVTGRAYTLPIIIVITHALVAIAYTDNQSSNLISTTEGVLYKTSAYYSESACWLHGDSLYFGFLLPVGIILVHNIGSFILVTYEIGWKSSTIQSSAGKRSTMSKIRIAVVLGILVGGTWILGFLLLISEDILYSLIMGWLFTIFNSSQGFFLFVLLCVRPKDMRQIWWSPIRRTLLTCTLIQRLSRNFNHQSSGEHSMQSERLPIQELPGEGSVMTTTSLPSATASHSSSPSPTHFRKGSPQTTTSKATQITTVSPCHSSQVKMQIRNQIISHPCVIKITSPDGDEATSKTL